MLRVSKSYDITTLAGDELSLHAAVQVGGAPALRELLQASAVNIDLPDMHGSTALHVAAWKGDVQAVSVLLTHGARTDVRRADGQRPLDLAQARAASAAKGCRQGRWTAVVAILAGESGLELADDLPKHTFGASACLMRSPSTSTMASECDVASPAAEELVWFPVGWEYAM